MSRRWFGWKHSVAELEARRDVLNPRKECKNSQCIRQTFYAVIRYQIHAVVSYHPSPSLHYPYPHFFSPPSFFPPHMPPRYPPAPLTPPATPSPAPFTPPATPLAPPLTPSAALCPYPPSGPELSIGLPFSSLPPRSARLMPSFEKASPMGCARPPLPT